MSSPTGADPLIGRHPEMALLRRRLADAAAGSGHLVLVTGPAGIGKTRLVEELVSGSDGAPLAGPVCWGAAVADAGMPALWPWLRAVRGLPAVHAAVSACASGGTERATTSAEEAAAGTFAADTAAVDALADHAREHPGLVVVLDDLQWADEASIRLLDRVSAEIRRLPVLVVGTHRDAVGGALAGDIAHRASEVVSLGPLSEQESAQVLAGAVADADRAEVRHAAELSGGSPLFLRTLARVAVEQLRGRASWDSGVGASVGAVGVGAKPELRHLVAVAMRAAGPDAAELVAALSVLGIEADPALLAALAGEDDPGLVVERLLPAVPAGLVGVPAGDGPVRFAHALVRDAAYATLAPSRRAALHRAAALALEPGAVSGDDRAGAVATHWYRAGDPARAATWAIRAAEASRAAGAYDESARYLSLALAAGRDVDRAELLLDLARVEYLGGHLEQSSATCLRAADEGERTGRPDVIARAAIVVQGLSHPEINQRTNELCRRALAALGDDAPLALRARVEAQYACTWLELEVVEESVRWSRVAHEHAVASGDPNAELDAIRAKVTLEWRPGFDGELVELGGRAIELADLTRRPLTRLWAHVWRSDGAIHLADMPGALRELAAIRSLAETSGLPLVRWHLLRREASLAALTGRFDDARAASAEAALVAEGWGDASVRYTNFGQAVFVASLRGDPGDLTPGWTAMVPLVESFPPVGKAGLASALLMVGRRDEAEALYRAVFPVVEDLDHPLAVASLTYLTDLAPALGDEAGCRALATIVRETFGGTLLLGAGTVAYTGSVSRLLGGLLLGCGEPEEAVAAFEEGLRVDARVGARPYVARGRLGLAHALAATGARGRAVEQARLAAAEARRLDMPGPLAEADAFLGEQAALARETDPLSSREREVLGLVAQALSNRDIAARLVLSERTVESHVRRILAKTGLTTRTELTRWFLSERS